MELLLEAWDALKRYLLCPVGLHWWTSWRTHKPPCAAEGNPRHETRQCRRCPARQHKFDGEKTRL
jgi:hypothetical protein